MDELEREEERWATRRRQLLEEITPLIRERYPLVSWKAHADLVTAAVDAKLLCERYGLE